MTIEERQLDEKRVETWQGNPNGVRITPDGRYIVGENPRRPSKTKRRPIKSRVGQGF